jgi:hypothetical protein
MCRPLQGSSGHFYETLRRCLKTKQNNAKQSEAKQMFVLLFVLFLFYFSLFFKNDPLLNDDNNKNENENENEIENENLKTKIAYTDKYPIEQQQGQEQKQDKTPSACFVMEFTPLGNVVMYYNTSRESFQYYSDKTIPFSILETVARKYCCTFHSKRLYKSKEQKANRYTHLGKLSNWNPLQKPTTATASATASYKDYKRRQTMKDDYDDDDDDSSDDSFGDSFADLLEDD